MMQPGNIQASCDMLYLASCALRQSPADPERVSAMDLPAVFKAAKDNGMEAAAYLGLGGCAPKEPWVESWRECRDKALRKSILFDVERGALFDYLEQQCIWYLPLKGTLLKELYPRPEMRQMVDSDILFDVTQTEAVQTWFLSRGYQEEVCENCFQYSKEPVYNFEMHTTLMEERSGERLTAYYQKAEQRLLPVQGKFQRRMTDEDFYIYLTLHVYKHFCLAGTGFRCLMDCCVFLEHHSDLDWGYVEQELEKLEVARWERQLRRISFAVFDREKPFSLEALSPEDREFFVYLAGSGTYGNAVQQLNNQINGVGNVQKKTTAWGKLRYLWKRLFPPMEIVQKNHPFFYRHRLLLPFLWLYRLVIRAPKAFGKFWRELRSLKKL